MSNISKPVAVKVDGRLIHYICPQCKKPVAFGKKISMINACKRCKQRLDWKPVEAISAELLYAEDSDEAAWIAKTYYESTGFKEENYIDVDILRQSLRGDGAELYLLFFNPKQHGRFMRKYAKEGTIHDG